MAYYNQNPPMSGAAPPQGYPEPGYQGYPPPPPPQVFVTQAPPQQPQGQAEAATTGAMAGCLAALCCFEMCCCLEICC